MQKTPVWVFIIIVILYCCAIQVNTMDIDASQYAEMSREMMKSGDFLHLYDRGLNYLDKPPFLFWVSALSMKVFGINNFGYKFPSLLFALWAIYATYRLAKLLYNEQTAIISALVLATCQGMFLMTNDVRCDTILMSWVISAIWMIQEWTQKRQLKYLLYGAVCIAFGMMTKGPIALMAPAFCFVADWTLKRQWKNFAEPRFLLAIIVIGILLIPMSIGLYQQFDLHPEKIIGGKTGVSGLRFFYWGQSFGRITGESPWKNGVDMSFLLVNMLWSFLPWIFLFVAAMISNSINLVKQRFKLLPSQEWITTGGFLLAYLSLGSSAYQLPHYIFVAFPLAAIITGRYIVVLYEQRITSKAYRIFTNVYYVISVLLLLVAMLLIGYAFSAPIPYIILLVTCICMLFYFIIKKYQVNKLFWVPAMAIIMVNFFMTNYFYPTILQYQVGSYMGSYLYEHHITGKDVITFKMRDPINSISFYTRDFVPNSDSLVDIPGRNYILTMDEGLKILDSAGYKKDTIYHGKLFKISELTPEFLNPKTRDHELKDYYLVKLK